MDIKTLFNKYGKTTYFISTADDWRSTPFGSIIIPYSCMQGAAVSCSADNKYVILCPPEHDISKLDKESTVVKVGGKKYGIIESGATMEQGKTTLAYGILKEASNG